MGERFERLEEQLAIVTGLWSTPDGVRLRLRGRPLPAGGQPGPAQAGAAARPADHRRGLGPEAHPAAGRHLRRRVQPGLRLARGHGGPVRAWCGRPAGRADRDPASLVLLGGPGGVLRPRRRRDRPPGARPSGARSTSCATNGLCGTPGRGGGQAGRLRRHRRRRGSTSRSSTCRPRPPGPDGRGGAAPGRRPLTRPGGACPVRRRGASRPQPLGHQGPASGRAWPDRVGPGGEHQLVGPGALDQRGQAPLHGVGVADHVVGGRRRPRAPAPGRCRGRRRPPRG